VYAPGGLHARARTMCRARGRGDVRDHIRGDRSVPGRVPCEAAGRRIRLRRQLRRRAPTGSGQE
jgi:hypothetical protein